MILPEGNTFGDIRGRIKCTPAEALANWGFVMRPDASGVVFRGYTYLNANGKKIKGTFISNYIPPGNPQTTKQQDWRKIMKDAVISWQDPHTDKPYWYKKARGVKMSGYNLFVREYLRQHH